MSGSHDARQASCRPAPGQGAYSMRLADLDTQLTQIRAMLDSIDRRTIETNRTIESLWVSIRKHPLLSKFLVGRGD